MDEDKLGSIDFPEFIEMLFYLEKHSREGEVSQRKATAGTISVASASAAV